MGMHSARKTRYQQITGSSCSLFKYLIKYAACINYYLFYLGSETEIQAQFLSSGAFLTLFVYGHIIATLNLALFL